MTPQPFIAVTDQQWFDFLSSRAVDGRVDEVNFWSPKARRPMARMQPGHPVFFRLKSPRNAIAGYGFFAHFTVLSLPLAWDAFGDKNGDPDFVRFLERIGEYRGQDLVDQRTSTGPLGCTILRDAVFWPRERWLSWAADQGWARNIVQGKAEDDPVRASRLLGEIQLDQMHPPEEFGDEFQLLEADDRLLRLTPNRPREGQGTFRARLLDSYGRRCAITGERTEPVLEAAHLQRYLGPRSNHVQNGMLLTQEFHTLFDKGLVTISPEYRVRVSPAIRDRWSNGRRYYAFDGQEIRRPERSQDWPSQAALEWHARHQFVA